MLKKFCGATPMINPTIDSLSSCQNYRVKGDEGRPHQAFNQLPMLKPVR
jgi:hypothetical protein